MAQHVNHITRLAAALSLVLVGLLSLAPAARADGLVYGSTIPAGEIVTQDVILYGNNVTIDGTVDGDVLAIGGNVTVNGDVNGSLVAAGETVLVNGKVQSSLYSGGVTLELGPSSSIGRSLYFGGLRLVTQPGSQIGRDLVAASLSAQLAGQVERDVKAVIGLPQLIGMLTGALSGGVSLPGGAGLPPGDIPQASARGDSLALVNSWGPRDGEPVALVSYVEHQPHRQAAPDVRWQADAPTSQAAAVGDWLLSRLRELVPLLVVGLLALWLVPGMVVSGAEQMQSSPLPAIGFGLLALVLAFNIFLVALLVAVLILLVGLWLGFLTLWQLAFLVWAIGFSSLVLAVSLFWLLVMYASKVIIAYLAGLLILKPIAPQIARHKVLPLVLGLVLYVLLAGIPILGWVIGVIVSGLGLGALWVAYRNGRLRAGHTISEPIEGEIVVA